MTMHVAHLRRLCFALLFLVFACGATHLFAQEKPVIDITGYVINARISPADHKLTATARVTFAALDDSNAAVFQLDSALKVEKVTDAANTPLTGVRGGNATIQITPPSPLVKGRQYTWTFTYDGELNGGDSGPVQGLKLTSIGDPVSYLLYAGAWFPMSGYQTDRFTADIDVTVPAGYKVIGSGSPNGGPKLVTDGQEYDFRWDKPGFPGTIIAGKFNEPVAVAGVTNIRVYTLNDHKKDAAAYVQTANKEFAYFTSTFGVPESTRLNIVELPNDTVPAYWAPEIAAIAGSHIGGKTDFRLLANTMAHQWWGSQISPASQDDAWITNGMSRYGELMYLEFAEGRGALETAVEDVSAGALAYDTIPLTSVDRLSSFSPQFQSMTLEKGAMVFQMLRWEVGENNFTKILRAALSQFTDKPISTSDFEKLAATQSQMELTPFFAQWLDGTGAPEFTNKYTVFRLGNNKGFRVIGEIQQDLDLFNMPVDLRIETDGKTVNKRIQVVGTNSQYQVDTFGRPRHITIDPDNWLLKNSPEMQVRVHILRGQQLVAQGDNPGALAEYQKALKADPTSSLANFRIGELLFNQRNYQASVNAYRDALNGDDVPKWTEVWSHIQIGKIFDVTGQRNRAVNEYRLAIQTNDNTQGALNEARLYLQKPFKRPAGD